MIIGIIRTSMVSGPLPKTQLMQDVDKLISFWGSKRRGKRQFWSFLISFWERNGYQLTWNLILLMIQQKKRVTWFYSYIWPLIFLSRQAKMGAVFLYLVTMKSKGVLSTLIHIIVRQQGMRYGSWVPGDFRYMHWDVGLG